MRPVLLASSIGHNVFTIAVYHDYVVYGVHDDPIVLLQFRAVSTQPSTIIVAAETCKLIGINTWCCNARRDTIGLLQTDAIRRISAVCHSKCWRSITWAKVIGTCPSVSDNWAIIAGDDVDDMLYKLGEAVIAQLY
jgi:hypothetical protein